MAPNDSSMADPHQTRSIALHVSLMGRVYTDKSVKLTIHTIVQGGTEGRGEPGIKKTKPI